MLFSPQIVEYEWAIGTDPTENITTIQDFVSVGREVTATNSHLDGLLEDEHTYYVTVRAKNGAGSWGNGSSIGKLTCKLKPITTYFFITYHFF